MSTLSQNVLEFGEETFNWFRKLGTSEQYDCVECLAKEVCKLERELKEKPDIAVVNAAKKFLKAWPNGWSDEQRELKTAVAEFELSKVIR